MGTWLIRTKDTKKNEIERTKRHIDQLFDVQQIRQIQKRTRNYPEASGNL